MSTTTMKTERAGLSSALGLGVRCGRPTTGGCLPRRPRRINGRARPPEEFLAPAALAVARSILF